MSAEYINEAYGSPVTNAAGSVHQILRFLRIIWYRKSTVFATAIIVGIIGVWYALTATKYYEASASILIVRSGLDASENSLGVNLAGQRLMPTHQQLIVSQPVLAGAIAYLPDACLSEFAGVPVDSWYHVLARKVSTNVVRNTTVLNLEYFSKDPQIAVAVVQSIIQSYLDFVDSTHKGATDKILKVMTLEKDQIAEELAEKEAALLSARLAVGDFTIEKGSSIVHPLIQTVVSLNAALVDAQKERLTHESILMAIQRAISRGEDLKQYAMAVEETIGRELLMTGLGFNRDEARLRIELERGLLKDKAELQSLASDFGPAHPRIIELQNRMQATREYLVEYKETVRSSFDELEATQLGPMLVQMVQQELNKSMQKEAALRDSLDDARAQAVLHERDTAHHNMLSQNVQRLQKLHEALVEKISGVDLRQGSGEIRATIIKEAVASDKIVSPKLSRVAFLCLLATLGIGCSIVYVQDIIDDRFRSPDELSKRLGRQLLAMVRELPSVPEQGMDVLQSITSPDSVEAESFRTLRTSLALSENESNRVCFTSAEPGDGKTTVVSNLAVVYAQSEKKTLLIDADLRRPGLTKLLDLKGQSGLSDVLYSEKNLKELVNECVIATNTPHLDVLPAGPRRQHPSELLSSDRMEDLLAWAETQYEQILIDCPPVLVASDALIIGRIVDGAVLVVRPEKNRRRLVHRAVESLTGMSIHLFGIVANCVNSENGKGYNFGDEHGYGYGYGYSLSDEENGEDAYPAIDFSGEDSTTGAQQTDLQTPRRAA